MHAFFQMGDDRPNMWALVFSGGSESGLSELTHLLQTWPWPAS